ncbi:MAG TPA: response regulator transcription factor [Draconibacterium sp.]|jgi:DNA-binding NarL/FixJ family response regulator|nr:response regulator transcription factor [Draconibacterium sp.]
MEKKKIKVIITDDHKLFRKGIIALLDDFDFIGETHEASNGAELIELLAKMKTLPDVILLDLRMPVMDGVEAHKKIRKLYPEIKVIILTMEDDEQYILHLISEGVNGYLLKNADPDEMERAILKVIENGYYFSENISTLVVKGMVKKELPEVSPILDFNERELQILELICKEFTAAEIAEKLNLSVRTVEGYRQKLIEKSGAKNVAGLVIFVVKNNLFPL